MFSEVRRKISFLRNSRLEWKRPPRAEIVVVDESGADEIVELFPGRRVLVVDLSGRTTNVRALVAALLKLRFGLFGYVVEYLRIVQPKVAVTLIDNTPFFYRLKDEIPGLQTFAIQNGWRSFESKRDLDAESATLSVDHLFCFGEVSRDLYNQSISGNFHVVGSFRSNKVPVRRRLDSRSIGIISTLRSKVQMSDATKNYSGRPDTPYSEIFSRRLEMASYVAEFCRRHDMKLVVLGKDPGDERERSLYTNLLEPLDVEWEYRPRMNLLSNYSNVDDLRIAVSTSSSLGYEALARGVRTAFFMIDPEVTGNFGDKFGWPHPYADSGEIWANFLDREVTHDILGRLHAMTDDDWRIVQSRYVPRLMSADPGNRTLIDLMHRSLDQTSIPK